MNVYHAPEAAAAAVSANASRPATALIHDSADARVVLFRIEPGQQVAEHKSSSTVVLVVISGAGIVSGATGDCEVSTGDIIAYGVNEPHGLRANEQPFVVAAVIAPRPAAH